MFTQGLKELQVSDGSSFHRKYFIERRLIANNLSSR